MPHSAAVGIAATSSTRSYSLPRVSSCAARFRVTRLSPRFAESGRPTGARWPSTTRPSCRSGATISMARVRSVMPSSRSPALLFLHPEHGLEGLLHDLLDRAGPAHGRLIAQLPDALAQREGEVR